MQEQRNKESKIINNIQELKFRKPSCGASSFKKIYMNNIDVIYLKNKTLNIRNNL